MVIVLLFQISAHAKMQPIIKENVFGKKYYYPGDFYEQITPQKIAMWTYKIFSPDALKKIFSIGKSSKPVIRDLTALLQPVHTIPQEESLEPCFTWIGHASFLIQVNGFNILTDPIFGDIKILNDPVDIGWWKVSVPGITFVKRAIEPGIKLEDLPRIDAVIISHNHSDHTDADALQYIARTYNPVIYVPEGEVPLMKRLGFKRVIEMSWWQEQRTIFKDGRLIAITCLPARHCSIRFSPLSYRASLWASWMIQAQTQDGRSYSFYFAGDTSYGSHFKEIAQHFPDIDVAFMPIGPTHESKNHAAYCHVDAAEAIDAFADLQARCFVPMHFGTFAWGEDHLYYPIKRFPELWECKQEKTTDKKMVWPLQCGKKYTVV